MVRTILVYIANAPAYRCKITEKVYVSFIVLVFPVAYFIHEKCEWPMQSSKAPKDVSQTVATKICSSKRS